MSKDGTLSFLLGDHLGSASLATDATGTMISEMRYKAWGEVRYASGETATDYTYTGQYSYASDFGLMFYNARWYDPSLGRFAQADTIVPDGVQGYDRYAYSNNNPVLYIDPTGHNGIPCQYFGGYGCDPGPQALVYASGVYTSAYEDGPTWDVQMDQDVWNITANPLHKPAYTQPYYAPGQNKPYGGGKQGQANSLYNPESPTACIGMSAGADSCVLYAVDRLKQGRKTTHLVLIGGTFNSEARPGFSYWEADLKRLMDNGTEILVVDDASIYEGDQGAHESYRIAAAVATAIL